MSRCFPYPPPGYEANGQDQALIVSLKLQREKERTKKDKKERHKEKKEKKEKSRGEKKEKSRGDKKEKSKKEKSIEHGKREAKKHGCEENKKRKHEEMDRMDSSVTEENEQPTVATLALNDSFDSIQSNAKRRKPNIDVEVGHKHGNGLLIRLPLLRHQGSELSCSPNKPTCPAKPAAACEFLPTSVDRVCSSSKVFLQKEHKAPVVDRVVSSSKVMLQKEHKPAVADRVVSSGNVILKKEQKPAVVDRVVSSSKVILQREHKPAVVDRVVSSSNVIPQKEHKPAIVDRVVSSSKVILQKEHKPPVIDRVVSSGEVTLQKEHKPTAVDRVVSSGKVALQKEHKPLAVDRVVSCSKVFLQKEHKPAAAVSVVEAKRSCPSVAAPAVVVKASLNVPKFPANEEQVVSPAGPDKLLLGSDATHRHSSKKTQRKDSLYKNLFEDWMPSFLQTEQLVSDNEEWLSERKQKSEPRVVELKSDSSPHTSSSDLVPRACYMPSVGLHALPYTIPF